MFAPSSQLGMFDWGGEKPEPMPLGFKSCVLYSKESKWWALKPHHRIKIHETEN